MASRAFLVSVVVSLAVVTRASPTGSGCTHKGKNYAEGEEFQDGCFSFKCIGGFLSFQSGECRKVDGSCLPVGEVYTNGCSRVECVTEQNDNGATVYKFKTVEAKCNLGGTCYKPGQSHKCLTCLADGDVERKCSYDGNCYDSGTKMEINCYNQTCSTEGEVIGFKKDSGQPTKCNYYGICLNPGEKYDACTSCLEDGSLDSTTGCAYKSSAGVETCAKNGEEGIDFFYGRDMKCTCTIDGTTRHSSCSSL